MSSENQGLGLLEHLGTEKIEHLVSIIIPSKVCPASVQLSILLKHTVGMGLNLVDFTRICIHSACSLLFVVHGDHSLLPFYNL